MENPSWYFGWLAPTDLEHLVISRRKFLKTSSEVALAMAALTTSSGARLSETLVTTAAAKAGSPDVDRLTTENCGRMQETSMSYVQSEQSEEQETRRVIDSFGETFSRRDADGLAALLTEDTVFEDTSPAPDGRRIEGRAAVVEFWRGWFARNPDASFETEEIIVCGKRAVVRWVCRKMRTGQPWHLRGVDIFAVRNGRVAAKLVYVKG
jgi:ketosteroid isomerase-like protein